MLVGRRRDGIPRWVFSGGKIEPGESPAQTAVRECAEEADLAVSAACVIGERTHPATRERFIYVACTPAQGLDVSRRCARRARRAALAGPGQLDALMPDLFTAVRAHLAADRDDSHP